MPVSILGDSAFRFSNNLMKPYSFSMALSGEQKQFNYQLSKCKREKAFGHLKSRFRHIGRGIDRTVGNTLIIVRACCVLHNFLYERNDSINQLQLASMTHFQTNRENPIFTTTISDNEPTVEAIRRTLYSYFSKYKTTIYFLKFLFFLI